jgi:hypothetical protein
MALWSRGDYAKELVEIALAPARSATKWVACKKFLKRICRPLIAGPLARRFKSLYGIDVTGEVAHRRKSPLVDKQLSEQVSETLATIRKEKNSLRPRSPDGAQRNEAIDLFSNQYKRVFQPPSLGSIAAQLQQAGFEVALRDTELGVVVYVVDRRNQAERVASHGVMDEFKIPDFLRKQAD